MDHVLAVGAAWLVLVEHLFEERLYTLHRSADGSMLSMISNALLFTGLMLDASGGVHAEYELFFTLIAAAAGAMISVIASFAIQKPRGFTLMPKNLLFAPKAMVQTLLYPAAALAIGLFMPGEDMGQICGFYAGLLLWRLSRTVCRRTDAESRPMNFMLIAPCAILAAAACFLLPAHDAALMCLAAALCAVAVFARIGVRNVSGIVLAAAAIAMQKMNLHWAASVICAVAAVVINSHRAFMKRV